MSLSLEKQKVNVGENITLLVKREQYTIESDTPHANWFQRVVCVFLDWIIAAIVFAVPAALIIQPIFGEETLTSWFGLTGKTFSDGDAVTWSVFVFYFIFTFYRPVVQALFHQTFAERFLNVYVANAQRTQLNLIQVLKRHACPSIFWLSVTFQFHFPSFTSIGFVAFLLWAGGSLRALKSDRRTFLDLFSGSYVYKKAE